MGGKDHSSARYIYTQLNKITRFIFPEEDDELLTYLDDDGYKIEPEYYVPIIPMVLVNGCEGIGTGYSTYIPKFNPADIIAYLKNKLGHINKTIKFVPWYRGFTGNIKKIDKFTYQTDGQYTIDKNKLIITELPIMVWTESYKTFLENNVTDKFINNSTDTTINFVLNADLDNDIYKALNCTSHLHTRRCHKEHNNSKIPNLRKRMVLELFALNK
jgi:DNA topoisomerase-2